MLVTILIVVVILMLLGVLPRWLHSRNWGYFPSGGLGFGPGYSDRPGTVGAPLVG